MTFARPVYLYLLLLMPLLLALQGWEVRRRKADLSTLGDLKLINRLTGSVNRRGRRWKNLLRFLSLACLIIALARPQWGVRVQEVVQRDMQVMVMLDVSRSMLARDVKPDRLSRAKLEIAGLMDRLNGGEIGLVLFSGASFIQFPLTSDYATARRFLDAADPAVISRPGTAIGDAIHTALGGFDMARASQKVIVLISDGEDHGERTLDAAQQAGDAGVLVYTLGVGSPQGEPIPEYNASGEVIGFKKDQSGQVVLSRLNESTLSAIAQAAGGEYYRVGTTGNALVDALQNLQGAASDTRFETLAAERFQLFVLLALLMLFSAELIPARKPGWRSADWKRA